MKLPRIIQDGLKLISGNVWGQFISFVAYLVLSRIYTPDDFSVFNIFYSYIEVLIILSTCKYELSIVIARSDREAAASARLALRMNTIFSLLILTALLVAYYLFPITSSLPAGVALMIPFMVFFCGTTRVYTFLFNRFKEFGQIAVSEVVTSTSGVLAKVGLAFSSLLHSVGLPLGTVLGKMLGNLNYLLRLRRLNLPKDITRQERREAAQKHKNFPLYTMPKDLMNSFSYNLPFLWLALYFAEDAVVGLFGLALTFTFRPINIFNSAFEKLLYVRTTEKVQARESIRGDIRKFAIWLNLIAFPLFLIAFVWAEEIFTFLFGGRWEGIGFYVKCLLPWVYVMLTSTSLSFLSNVFGRQRTEFFFYIGLLLLRIVAVVYGIVAHDFAGAILYFALSGAVVSLLLLVWYSGLIRRYERGL